MKPRGELPVHKLPEQAFLASDHSAAFGEHAPSHRIDFYAVVWFSETRGEHFIDFEAYPVARDFVHLIGRNQVHSIPAARLPKARTIVFSADFFDRIEELYLRQLFLPFNNAGIGIPAGMVTPMKRLFELILLEADGAANAELLLKYVSAFLTQLFRFSNGNDSVSGPADQRIPRLFQLIQEHYREQRGADFYARSVRLTPKRMNEILRQAVGRTLSQLLYDLLIIEAKRELFHQDLSIKEIAYELGFSEQSYFARFFRKHAGQTPEGFRKTAALHSGARMLRFR